MAGPATGVRDHTELCGEHDLVPSILDGLTDECFVDERPINFSGVDQGDAEVEGSVDGADGLGVVCARSGECR